MKFASAATFALCFVSSSVALAASTAPAPSTADPAATCKSGQGRGASHPSNACWDAYDQAMARKDYLQALAAVRVGCEKYERADYCIVVSQIRREPAQIVQPQTAAQRNRLGNALNRAAVYVDLADVEDGEAGVLVRQTFQTEAARTR